ncbi:hypothetical protein [Nocardioides sp. 616]|uniref:hypothetical protein n=1 Tax=Nocardioides sp. 616 TaxID=2268090 RepID=UPI0013B44C75|nr:hypothetical protein [Nocardioides sp. 616]
MTVFATLLGAMPPACALPNTSVVITFTYDSVAPSAATTASRAVRGPPVEAHNPNVTSAEDPESSGASERPGGPTAGGAYDYDGTVQFVQVDKTTGAIVEPARTIRGDRWSLQRSQDAANFGPRSLGAAQRLRYEGAPYHGATNRGLKNAAPTNGQSALNFSTQVKATSPRRIGVDPDANEFVIFDQTVEGVFHGHARSWSELTGGMQSVLRKAGMVDRRGNIL